MLNERSLLSQTIDVLRFPMAATVVLLHSAALGVGSTHPVYSTLSIAIGRGFCRIAVPCFFLISSFLFFTKLEQKWDTRTWLDKLRKRSRTLLLPYLFWNIIAAFAIWGYRWFFAKQHGELYPSFFAHIKDQGGIWDAGDALPFDGPLWFIRYLILFIIAAPLVWIFVKYLKLYGVSLLTLLFIAVGIVPEGLVLFTWGAWFRMEGRNILADFQRVRWPALAIMLSTWILLTLAYRSHPVLYRISSSLYILSGIVIVFLLAARGLSAGRLRVRPFLVQSSFFIFAAHNILILHDFSHWVILHLLPFQGEWMECIDLFMRPALAVLICLGLFGFMEKFTPKTLALLTGGRG